MNSSFTGENQKMETQTYDWLQSKSFSWCCSTLRNSCHAENFACPCMFQANFIAACVKQGKYTLCTCVYVKVIYIIILNT